jgi:hypothetical protein
MLGDQRLNTTRRQCLRRAGNQMMAGALNHGAFYLDVRPGEIGLKNYGHAVLLSDSIWIYAALWHCASALFDAYTLADKTHYSTAK